MSHSTQTSERDEASTSMNDRPIGERSFRILSFTAATLLAVVPLSIDISEMFTSAIRSIFEWILSAFAGAFFGTIGWIFARGTEAFLFFAPPSQHPELQGLWYEVLPIFWLMLPVTGSVFFLAYMLMPENENADIYQFLERTLIAIVALAVTSPIANFTVGPFQSIDLFSATVYVVNNVIGAHIFPDSYSIAFMQGSINTLMGGIAGAAGIVGTIAASVWIGIKFSVAIVLVVGLFYIILAMRMILVYVVYSMFPVLLAFWIPNIGPLKYGTMVASLVFKTTALLLLLGVIISAILATTGTIAGSGGGTWEALGLGDYDDVDEPPRLIDDDNSIDDDVVNQEVGEGGETGSSSPPAGFSAVVLQIFAWFGGIVLSIATVTSGLGALISMRGTSGTRSRARQGHPVDSRTSVGSTAATGSGGQQAVGTASGDTVAAYQTADGMVAVHPEHSDKSFTIDADGNFETHTSEGDMPVPDEMSGLPENQTAINEKVQNIASNASDLGEEASAATRGMANEGMEKLSSNEKTQPIIERGKDTVKRAQDKFPTRKVEGASSYYGGIKSNIDQQRQIASSLSSRVSSGIDGVKTKASNTKVGSGLQRHLGAMRDLGGDIKENVTAAAKVSGNAYMTSLTEPTIEDGIVRGVEEVRKSIDVKEDSGSPYTNYDHYDDYSDDHVYNNHEFEAEDIDFDTLESDNSGDGTFHQRTNGYSVFEDSSLADKGLHERANRVGREFDKSHQDPHLVEMQERTGVSEQYDSITEALEDGVSFEAGRYGTAPVADRTNAYSQESSDHVSDNHEFNMVEGGPEEVPFRDMTIAPDSVPRTEMIQVKASTRLSEEYDTVKEALEDGVKFSAEQNLSETKMTVDEESKSFKPRLSSDSIHVESPTSTDVTIEEIDDNTERFTNKEFDTEEVVFRADKELDAHDENGVLQRGEMFSQSGTLESKRGDKSYPFFSNKKRAKLTDGESYQLKDVTVNKGNEEFDVGQIKTTENTVVVPTSEKAENRMDIDSNELTSTTDNAVTEAEMEMYEGDPTKLYRQQRTSNQPQNNTVAQSDSASDTVESTARTENSTTRDDNESTPATKRGTDQNQSPTTSAQRNNAGNAQQSEDSTTRNDNNEPTRSAKYSTDQGQKSVTSPQTDNISDTQETEDNRSNSTVATDESDREDDLQSYDDISYEEIKEYEQKHDERY